MNIKAQQFYEELKDKKVAFIGAGVSHKQLIGIFAKKGAQVTLCDKKQLEDFGESEKPDLYFLFGVDISCHFSLHLWKI